MFEWSDSEDNDIAMKSIKMKINFINVCLDNGQTDIAHRECIVLQSVIGTPPIVCALRDEITKRHLAGVH
jgi:hypothetical protein